MTLPDGWSGVHPRRLFGIGVTVGVVVGLVVGSVLAFWLGDETIEAARSGVDRLLGRRDQVNFELLLQ